MATPIIVEIKGLASFKNIAEELTSSPVASQRAVNYALNRARARSSREARLQVAFPARYLSGADGKIDLVPATKANAEGRLTASSQPRSLASFVVSATRHGGVKVRVKPGSVRTLPKAFLLKGRIPGLAVRSANKPRGAYIPKKLGKNLWILYGPSVAQVLLSRAGRGIWPSMEAEILNDLQSEYLRQLKLET